MVSGLKRVKGKMANKQKWRKLSREGLGERLVGGLEIGLASMGRNSACLV